MKSVVIIFSILGSMILLGVIVPMITAQGIDAHKARTRQEMSFLQTAFSLYIQEYGKLPGSSLNAEIIDVITGKNPRKLSFYSAPTHLVREGQLMDDWDRPFLFEKVDGNMLIRSAGKDGIYHTQDDLTLEALALKSAKAE